MTEKEKEFKLGAITLSFRELSLIFDNVLIKFDSLSISSIFQAL